MNLYENVAIGGFLFALGVEMARRQPNLPLVSINLLQQTPLDRQLGDVLLANAGVCRLIEFKRAGKLTRKEMRKLGVLREALRQTSNPDRNGAISRRIHWYIEIEEPKTLGSPVIAQACPYLDFTESPTFVSLDQFASSAADEAFQQGMNDAARVNQLKYLKWVCRNFSEVDSQKFADERPSANSGAFLVAIDQKGKVSWLAVPSLGYVLMNEQELFEALEPLLKQKAAEQNIELGFGLGM